ncbi:MAG: hypothetical protein JWL77_1951 [Chthonomonadaceae bacterium]|nr:hypothetical protein [Chthonomonadaceae bacterium]
MSVLRQTWEPDSCPRPFPVRALLLLILGVLLLVPTITIRSNDFPQGKPQALLTITRPLTPAEIAARDTHQLYEPAVGCYLGAFIDFDGSLKKTINDQNGTKHQDSGPFEQIVGKPHSMYFFYMGYGRRLPMDWLRKQAVMNKFVHIAMEPNDGVELIKDDAYLNQLADDMARSGAKIFLRFGSEMNGAWSIYCRNPAEYRRAFRVVYQVMHRRAPNVALVWCPYCTPTSNIADFYPGDDATDWVGINMYNVTYHNNNIKSPGENEHPCDLLSYVYDRYAARKPMMICEYAATHSSAVEGVTRPDFALRKILTLYNALPRLYPRVKSINYFDSNNLQFVTERAYNDYSVTDDTSVNDAYRYSISAPYYLPGPLPDRAPPPPAPMPMRPNELLKGKAVFSCFARTPSDKVSLRYKIDGIVIYRAYRPDLWECTWDAGSVKPGKHILTLEVTNLKGSVVAKQSLPVITSR